MDHIANSRSFGFSGLLNYKNSNTPHRGTTLCATVVTIYSNIHG